MFDYSSTAPTAAKFRSLPEAGEQTDTPLLSVSGLSVVFPSASGPVQASDQVDLDINSGESLCLVGESGCGKTIVALAVTRLLPAYAHIKGQINFKGRNILDLDPEGMRSLRGREIATIFEQPASCLNPVFRVGKQIAEAVRNHKSCSHKAARNRAVELMALMGLPRPKKLFHRYPHEFSGGMAQRAMIAMALAFNPDLLIADEPTTSLDVTIQAQIVELLHSRVRQSNTSLLLITHDLRVAAELCDQVAVMYAGSIVERGPLREVLTNPRHPYTMALVGAARGDDTNMIDGSVPELSRLPKGCRFHPRCPKARNVCRLSKPPLENDVRCHFEAKV